MKMNCQRFEHACWVNLLTNFVSPSFTTIFWTHFVIVKLAFTPVLPLLAKFLYRSLLRYVSTFCSQETIVVTMDGLWGPLTLFFKSIYVVLD